MVRTPPNQVGCKLTLESKIDLNRASLILSLISFLFISFAFLTGNLSVLYKYEKGIDDGGNTFLVYISILLCVNTVVEFARLNRKSVNGYFLFLKKVNKFYFVLMLFFSSLLILTGNRSEALLIVLPVLFSFSFLIKRIKLALFCVIFFIGFVMVRDFVETIDCHPLKASIGLTLAAFRAGKKPANAPAMMMMQVARTHVEMSTVGSMNTCCWNMPMSSV